MAGDWRENSACKDEDPEMFFPAGKGDSEGAKRQADLAKAVCAYCPVVSECRALALDLGLDHGVFGGMDETERRALRRRSKALAS